MTEAERNLLRLAASAAGLALHEMGHLNKAQELWEAMDAMKSEGAPGSRRVEAALAQAAPPVQS